MNRNAEDLKQTRFRDTHSESPEAEPWRGEWGEEPAPLPLRGSQECLAPLLHVLYHANDFDRRIAVRATLEQVEPLADRVLNSIRGVLRRMNAECVAYDAESMEQIISRSLAAQRYSMILLGGFAALALLLASVGIYGVISYVVGQRTQEIGIRLALGAQRGHVSGLVIGDGARLILIGLAAGAVAALALTQLMASLLFGVSPTDPLTFACVAMLLALVALLACYVPARRAARVNPITALRCE